MDESLSEQQIYSSIWTTFIVRKAMSITLYSINESSGRQTVRQNAGGFQLNLFKGIDYCFL